MTTTMTAPKRTTGGAAANAAFAWSLTAIAVGIWQFLSPENGPFADPVNRPLIAMFDFLPTGAGPALLTAAGVAGLFVPRVGAKAWPLTAAFAIVFGTMVPTTMVIAMAGYLCAFALPAVLLAGPALLARGRVAKAAVAGGVALVVAVLAVAGPLAPSVLAELGRDLGGGLADLGLYPVAELWSAVGGACWTVLTVGMLTARRRDGRKPAWMAPERAARWGTAASYIAFASALPYGLTRLTWLTPWPHLMSAEALAAQPGMRVWGLLLGLAALGGGTLCLGLARPWGERWPYWVPGLRGRPVPPKVAIVPASLAAYLFTITAAPFSLMAIEVGHAELIWLFPFYVWGPSLGAATLAYAIRRGVVQA